MKSPVFLLPYAGTLPFVCAALSRVISLSAFITAAEITHIILLYSLAILSFMAGVHWGQYVAGRRSTIKLLISSNVITLAGWFGSFYLSPQSAELLFIALFALLYLIDGGLGLDTAYLQMRRNVTLIVCASLLVICFA